MAMHSHFHIVYPIFLDIEHVKSQYLRNPQEVANQIQLYTNQSAHKQRKGGWRRGRDQHASIERRLATPMLHKRIRRHTNSRNTLDRYRHNSLLEKWNSRVNEPRVGHLFFFLTNGGTLTLDNSRNIKIVKLRMDNTFE